MVRMSTNNEDINNNNNNEEIVGENEESTSIDLKQTNVDLNQQQVNWKILATSNNPTPRFDNTLVHYNNFIYSYGGSENSTNSSGFQSFVKLDLSTFHWQTLSCPTRTRIVHTGVLHGDCMYIFGGGVYEDVRTAFYSTATTKVFKTLNELWKYEFLTNTWTQLLPNQADQQQPNTTVVPSGELSSESTPDARDGHCAVVVGDEMYIIGGSQTVCTGSGRTQHISSVFFTCAKIYNITSNTWRTITAPPLGRLGSAVVYKHLDGSSCIYYFGGYGANSHPTADLWKYDIKAEKWSLINNKQPTTTTTTTTVTTTTTTTPTTTESIINIPEARYGHSANVFQDKMLVYGGYSKKKGFLRDFYSFDFDKEEWKQILTEGPPKRRRHSTVLIENYGGGGKPKLFLYGGTYQSCLYNDLWEYSFPNPVLIPSDNLVEDFTILFKNAKKYFSDVSFIVEGNEIHAHRNILSVRSNYFQSLFTSGLKESFEKQITINERYDDFNLLIEFLYSGNEELVQLENCIGILYLSDLYCVPRLKTICEAKAIEGIDCETVVNIFNEADSFKLVKLRKLCLNFIARNHKELVKQGSLNQLAPSVLIEVMDYLSISSN